MRLDSSGKSSKLVQTSPQNCPTTQSQGRWLQGAPSESTTDLVLKRTSQQTSDDTTDRQEHLVLVVYCLPRICPCFLDLFPQYLGPPCGHLSKSYTIPTLLCFLRQTRWNAFNLECKRDKRQMFSISRKFAAILTGKVEPQLPLSISQG